MRHKDVIVYISRKRKDDIALSFNFVIACALSQIQSELC
jgi:hypothetical protein